MAAVLAKANRKAGLRTKKSRRTAPYIITGVLILLIGGGGYYAYAHRDNLPGAIAGLKQTVTGLFASKDSTPTSAPSSQTGSADAGKPATVPASTGDAGAAGQKFTQKLMPDGTEVDEGASNAAANSGEGRSVAQQNGGANPAAPVSGGAASAPATTTPVQGAPFTVPENGQKAYLYEERLGQTTPTTVQGYIVWEARHETGDSGKPEPEIQGKLTIPERGLTALITFKRNTDSSLPASHLMEIVFSVPQNFEGGGIDSVQRVAMKTSEQDRGDPIVAVPAKITDDTFMIAFNDFAEVVARNVDLLRSRDWIDIPVTYRNGRRALITLDKGWPASRSSTASSRNGRRSATIAAAGDHCRRLLRSALRRAASDLRCHKGLSVFLVNTDRPCLFLLMNFKRSQHLPPMFRQFRCDLLMIEDEQQQCQGSDTTMNEIGERIAAFLGEPASDDIAGGGTDALDGHDGP